MSKQWRILAESSQANMQAAQLIEYFKQKKQKVVQSGDSLVATAVETEIDSSELFTITESPEEAGNGGVYLRMGENGLSLTDGTLEMTGDLTRMLPRLKRNNLLQEMLVKAAKIKGAGDGLKLVDATAGMGEDSLLLAAAGFEVELYEYDPIIAILLADSLRRASEVPELSSAINRMHLHVGDSIQALHEMADLPQEEKPAVVLLDPMFPERNKTGLIKKKFQLLQQLESPCSNEGDLLQAAKAAGPRKIVIKRPAKGPNLAGVKPSYSMPGKAIRYDCIVL